MSRPNFERLAPPPRPVSLGLRVFTLFGEPLGQIGWFLLGFSSIFVWTFVMNAEILPPFLLRGPVSTAVAQVTYVEATSARENRSRVWAVDYTFRPGDGTRRAGRSYVTGSAPAIGDSVTVEFAETAPQLSRIKGMRSALFGPAVVIVLIFPAVALLLLVFSLRGRLVLGRLLRDGRLAQGKLKERAPTNMRVNNRRVYRLAFDFVGEDGRRHEAQESTSQTAALEDEPSESLLYLPESPSTAALVDGLPDSIQADTEGNLYLATPSSARLALLLPLVVTLGNAACAFVRWTR